MARDTQGTSYLLPRQGYFGVVQCSIWQWEQAWGDLNREYGGSSTLYGCTLLHSYTGILWYARNVLLQTDADYGGPQVQWNLLPGNPPYPCLSCLPTLARHTWGRGLDVIGCGGCSVQPQPVLRPTWSCTSEVVAFGDTWSSAVTIVQNLELNQSTSSLFYTDIRKYCVTTILTKPKVFSQLTQLSLCHSYSEFKYVWQKQPKLKRVTNSVQSFLASCIWW